MGARSSSGGETCEGQVGSVRDRVRATLFLQPVRVRLRLRVGLGFGLGLGQWMDTFLQPVRVRLILG